MSGASNHLQKLIDVWPELTLPLRPLEPVPSIIKSLISAPDDRLLIMGVTPDFADLTTDVTALDQLPEMIAGVWPGDTKTRRAILGDWWDMPFSAASFDVVVNDNGFSFLPFPDQTDNVLTEIHRVLKPGGKAILRWTLAPETAMSDDELINFSLTKCDGMMEALRWQFAVQTAARSGKATMQLGDAYDLFCRLFPDTAALRAANGWDAETFARMAFYKGGTLRMDYPKRAEMITAVSRHFAHVEIVDSGDYPMSELEPLVVLTK